MLTYMVYVQNFKRTIFSKTTIILVATYFVLQLGFLIFNSTSLDQNDSFSNLLLYGLETSLLGIMAVIIFSYLTLKVFYYDIKNNLHKLELRNGASFYTVFFSRIVLLVSITLLMFGIALVLATIFYTTNKNIYTFLPFKFSYQPVFFSWIISYLALSLTLVPTLMLNGRISGIIASVAMMIVILFGGFGGTVQKHVVKNEYGRDFQAKTYLNDMYVAANTFDFRKRFKDEPAVLNDELLVWDSEMSDYDNAMRYWNQEGLNKEKAFLDQIANAFSTEENAVNSFESIDDVIRLNAKVTTHLQGSNLGLVNYIYPYFEKTELFTPLSDSFFIPSARVESERQYLYASTAAP